MSGAGGGKTSAPRLTMQVSPPESRRPSRGGSIDG
jgi:hypothetical protein